jgi:hypothetical protein
VAMGLLQTPIWVLKEARPYGRALAFGPFAD